MFEKENLAMSNVKISVYKQIAEFTPVNQRNPFLFSQASLCQPITKMQREHNVCMRHFLCTKRAPHPP